MATDILNVFSLMDEGLRKNKPTGKEDVKRVWKYKSGQRKPYMQEKLK